MFKTFPNTTDIPIAHQHLLKTIDSATLTLSSSFTYITSLMPIFHYEYYMRYVSPRVLTPYHPPGSSQTWRVLARHLQLKVSWGSSQCSVYMVSQDQSLAGFHALTSSRPRDQGFVRLIIPFLSFLWHG